LRLLGNLYLDLYISRDLVGVLELITFHARLVLITAYTVD